MCGLPVNSFQHNQPPLHFANKLHICVRMIHTHMRTTFCETRLPGRPSTWITNEWSFNGLDAKLYATNSTGTRKLSFFSRRAYFCCGCAGSFRKRWLNPPLPLGGASAVKQSENLHFNATASDGCTRRLAAIVGQLGVQQTKLYVDGRARTRRRKPAYLAIFHELPLANCPAKRQLFQKASRALCLSTFLLVCAISSPNHWISVKVYTPH